jgi:hypothetical protein
LDPRDPLEEREEPARAESIHPLPDTGDYVVNPPLPVTTYFGADFRVDGLFFVIDRSGTVRWPGGFPRAKEETERLILGMPPGLQFAVIFSDQGIVRWPTPPIPAESTEEMIASGAAFVRSVHGGSGSCDQQALLYALQYVGNSRGRSNAIFYVTDGAGTCRGGSEDVYLEETLEAVTAANAGRARIHTFNITSSVDQETFLQTLAARNGGTYHPLR